MDSHEIVIGETESERRVVVFPLLTESVSQAGESANLHSHGEVLSFNVAGANLLGGGASDDWHHLR